MKWLSRSNKQMPAVARRLPGRLVAMIAGLIMMIVGLAMTATIVLLPGGVILGLLGVATLVFGLFAPDLHGDAERRR